MIKFDVNKLTVDVVKLKSCTTALQGSIRVLDEENSSGKETYKKINVPMAIVRTFQARHKTSNYMKPVVTAVVKYDGHPVALERHPLGTLGERVEEGLFDDNREWISDSQHNINTLIKPLCKDETIEWFFDGKFMYSFANAIEKSIRSGEYLTQSGNFRAVEVSAIQLSHLNDRTKLEPAERTCLAYVTADGQHSITPPIWKKLADVGTSALNRSDAEDEDRQFQFDAVDQHLAVNLAFGLKAGKIIGLLFGHEEIEPLQLPELMIRLNTVNLPKISSKVKSTYNIGMTFTQAMAWLIGMSNRIDSLESYMVIRSLLKYLTTKGIYRKNMFSQVAVFKKGHDLESIKLISKEDAMKTASNISVDDIVSRIRGNINRRQQQNNAQIGRLFDAS